MLRRIRKSWEQARPRFEMAGAAGLGQTLRSLHADIEEVVSLNEQAMIAYERRRGGSREACWSPSPSRPWRRSSPWRCSQSCSAYRISRPVTEVADRLHEALNPTCRKTCFADQTIDEIVRLREELDALLLRLARYEDEQQRKLSHLFEESRRRFISMLSHQLKTPMTSLSMAVNLIREKLKDAAPAQAELLAIATESCNSLSTLVSDLIDAAREARRTSRSSRAGWTSCGCCARR